MAGGERRHVPECGPAQRASESAPAAVEEHVSGGVRCPWRAEWPQRSRAQLGRMREMSPFPAGEAPLPRRTGSGPTPQQPECWSAESSPKPAAWSCPTPFQLAAGDLFEHELLA